MSEDIESICESFVLNEKEAGSLFKDLLDSNSGIRLHKENVFLSYVFDLMVSENDALKGLALQILTKLYS